MSGRILYNTPIVRLTAIGSEVFPYSEDRQAVLFPTDLVTVKVFRVICRWIWGWTWHLLVKYGMEMFYPSELSEEMMVNMTPS